MNNRRRFTATQQTTIRDLQRTMVKIGATSLKINQDVMDGKVEIIFDRNALRYIVRSEAWPDSLDNLRAASLSIEYLYRAIEGYGVSMEESKFDEIFQRHFGGFIATPDDTTLMLSDGSAHWYEVLGVEQSASRGAIMNAYRALAKVHHPDVGGNAEDFRKLRHAYEQGLAQLKSK